MSTPSDSSTPGAGNIVGPDCREGDKMPPCDVPQGYKRRAGVWWCGDDTEYGCDCTQPYIEDVRVGLTPGLIGYRDGDVIRRYTGVYNSRDRDYEEGERQEQELAAAKKRWNIEERHDR